MNDTLNHATRRLLQVALDMLRNPEADKPPPDDQHDLAPGRLTYFAPPQFRTDTTSVEAAWRAVREAQQLLAEELTRGEIEAFDEVLSVQRQAQGGAS